MPFKTTSIDAISRVVFGVATYRLMTEKPSRLAAEGVRSTARGGFGGERYVPDLDQTRANMVRVIDVRPVVKPKVNIVVHDASGGTTRRFAPVRYFCAVYTFGDQILSSTIALWSSTHCLNSSSFGLLGQPSQDDRPQNADVQLDG